MFDTLSRGPRRTAQQATSAAVSLGVHAFVVFAIVFAASYKAAEVAPKEVEVKFIGPGAGKGPPPPPPPPAGKKSQVRRKPMIQPTKVEIPRPIEIPKELPPEEPKDSAAEDDGEEGGVEGGVKGGVIGGVVGGVVGGTGGGGEAPPPPERPKAKTVPPFVIARDIIRQPPPRLSEVFKQAHRGQNLVGTYRVCVGLDGHVYEVTVIKPVPGADEDIIDGIKNEWLYKEQEVPKCFNYIGNISIVQ